MSTKTFNSSCIVDAKKSLQRLFVMKLVPVYTEALREALLDAKALRAARGARATLDAYVSKVVAEFKTWPDAWIEELVAKMAEACRDGPTDTSNGLEKYLRSIFIANGVILTSVRLDSQPLGGRMKIPSTAALARKILADLADEIKESPELLTRGSQRSVRDMVANSIHAAIWALLPVHDLLLEAEASPEPEAVPQEPEPQPGPDAAQEETPEAGEAAQHPVALPDEGGSDFYAAGALSEDEGGGQDEDEDEDEWESEEEEEEEVEWRAPPVADELDAVRHLRLP